MSTKVTKVSNGFEVSQARLSPGVVVGGPARFASAVALATLEAVALNQRLHYWLHHLLVDVACLVAGQLHSSPARYVRHSPSGVETSGTTLLLEPRTVGIR